MLVAEGKDLYVGHYLKCGGPQRGASRRHSPARGRIISEQDAGELEDHIVDWPSKQGGTKR